MEQFSKKIQFKKSKNNFFYGLFHILKLPQPVFFHSENLTQPTEYGMCCALLNSAHFEGPGVCLPFYISFYKDGIMEHPQPLQVCTNVSILPICCIQGPGWLDTGPASFLVYKLSTKICNFYDP